MIEKTGKTKSKRSFKGLKRDRGELTEPSAVGLDAGIGKLLGLELVLQDLPLPVPLRPGIVHLEPPHRGGRPTALGIPSIAAVDVQGVLRLP